MLLDNADFPTIAQSRANSLSLDDGGASRHGTPPIPPGFVLNESRRTTPTIPPGLSKPTALPNLDDGPISRPGSRATLRRQASTQQILPALPLRPATPARSENKDAKRTTENETPTKMSKGVSGRGKTPLVSDEQTDETVKPAVPRPVGSHDIEARATIAAAAAANIIAAPLRRQDEPLVESPRPTSRAKEPVPGLPQSSVEGPPIPRTSSARPAPTTPIKSEVKKDGQKRKNPGKLDIPAAVTKNQEAVAADSSSTSTPAKSVESCALARSPNLDTPSKLLFSRTVSQTPPIMPRSDSPSGDTPLSTTKAVPRTLRLVQTPKAEATPATIKLPSRKPSVASINPPGTPSSEHVSISDNISLASTSMSRANSPPPSRVGSAPVRTKTKSQMKKDRQERAKAIVQVEEEGKAEAEAEAEAEGPAQEAIVSRKKKEKKAKERKAKSNMATSIEATSAVTRPASPAQKGEDEVKIEHTIRDTMETRLATPTKAQVVMSPPRPPMPSPHEPSPPPTPTLTAASLIAEIRAQAPELQQCIDSLFRTPANTHFKPQQPVNAKDLQSPHSWKHDFKINLTKDEVDALVKGTLPAVHYGGQEGRTWDRGMVTGSGAHLRALTLELEQRFLELEKALREVPSELRFRPSKPQNETQFPHIDLAALQRQFDHAGARGVSVMEQMVQDGSTMKKGAFLVDEASKYVNEFVMPPTPPMPSAQLQPGPAPVPDDGSLAALEPYIHRTTQPAGAVPLTPGEEVSVRIQIADRLERGLSVARREADEKDGALRKVIKKNRKLLGMS